MSVCPHPRGPVERVVGPVSMLVCPDCGERFSPIVSIDPEPEAPAPKRSRKSRK